MKPYLEMTNEELKQEIEEIKKEIMSEVTRTIGETYFCVINVDYKMSSK